MYISLIYCVTVCSISVFGILGRGHLSSYCLVSADFYQNLNAPWLACLGWEISWFEIYSYVCFCSCMKQTIRQKAILHFTLWLCVYERHCLMPQSEYWQRLNISFKLCFEQSPHSKSAIEIKKKDPQKHIAWGNCMLLPNSPKNSTVSELLRLTWSDK